MTQNGFIGIPFLMALFGIYVENGMLIVNLVNINIELDVITHS